MAGFTLIELVMTILILGSVSLILTQINWNALKVLDYFQYPPEGYKYLFPRSQALPGNAYPKALPYTP